MRCGRPPITRPNIGSRRRDDRRTVVMSTRVRPYLRSLASTKCVLALAIVSMLLPYAAGAEYRLAPGDVLEISVAGIPDLRTRAPVNVDGAINVPLLGRLTVEGLSLQETQANVQQVLSGKVFHQRTTDGR